MTTYSYIILTDSSGSTLSKKFLVSAGGYRVTLRKAQSENETIGGIDVAMGTIHEVHEYQIKVRAERWTFTSSGSYQEVPDDYGILDDLETFYAYNNPNGVPSNVITMVDHFGNTKLILFVGDFPKSPVSTILESSQAVYFLPVRFRVIPT